RPPSIKDGRMVVKARVSQRFPIIETDGQQRRFVTLPNEPAPGGGFISVTNEAVSRGGYYAFGGGAITVGMPGQWQGAWLPGQTVGGEPIAAAATFFGNRPAIDERGQMTFSMRFEPSAGTSEFRAVRWNEKDGLYPLARAGDPVPGGGILLQVYPFSGVNARGDAALGTLVQRQPGGPVTDAVFLLDNCAADVLFADGFESGATDAWSATVP
ncbi:MAG: hypothetical protein AAGF23_21860, partial [Acidobacteriota bacterium]